MPLVPQMTVSDAANEIAVRLGFTDQGTARARAETRIRSFIRQAINELEKEVEWADNVFEIRIDLINHQDRYEYPEEAKNGNVISVQCELTRGQRYDLQGGIRTQEFVGRPSDESSRVPIGDPMYWRIIDREIQIRPAPIDVTRIPSLVILLQRSVPAVLEPGTLLPFDSELIIQRCTVLGRTHYQMPGQDDAKANYAKYLDRVKARQGAAKVFFVGGMKSHFVTRDKHVRQQYLQHRSRGTGAPYTQNWAPW